MNKWDWNIDSGGFIPQCIIDKENEPDFFINAKFNNNGDLIIVLYGFHVQGTLNKEFDCSLYVIESDVYTRNIDEFEYIFKDSDIIDIAFGFLEVSDPIVYVGFDTRNEAMNKAHELFTNN
jgi:hypothetical protein